MAGLEKWHGRLAHGIGNGRGPLIHGRDAHATSETEENEKEYEKEYEKEKEAEAEGALALTATSGEVRGLGLAGGVCGGGGDHCAGGEGGELAGEVFEFGQLGEPAVGLREVLDAKVDARAEGFGVFVGDGVGADQLGLLDQALLFGEGKVEVGAGLGDTCDALAEGVETIATRGEEFSTGFERGVVVGGGGEFGFERGDFAGGGLLGLGQLFASFGFEINLEGLFDREEAQVGPEEFVEFAQAGVE